MPFVSIDWSRYYNSSGDQTHVIGASEVLQKLTTPSRYVLYCTGLRLDYSSSRLSSTKRRLSYVHKLLATMVAMCVGLVSLSALRFLHLPLNDRWPTTLFCSLHMQEVGCAATLTVWQLSRRPSRFHKLLLSCTTGIGVLRQQKLITRCYYVVATVSFSLAALWTIYRGTAMVAIAPPPGNYTSRRIRDPFPEPLLGTKELNALAFLCHVYLGACWSLSHIYFFLFCAILYGEFRSLNDDLQADTNLFQVPVVKHYVYVHYRLRKLLTVINRQSGGYLGMLATTGVFQLSFSIYILITVAPRAAADQFLLASFAITSLLQLGAVVVVAMFVRREVTFISRVMDRLAASDKNLDISAFPIVLQYQRQISKGRNGLNIGWAFTISGKTLFLVGSMTMLILTKLLAWW